MIISKEIKVDINQFNAHQYRKMGYDVSGSFIMLKIEHIGSFSSFKINVQCDFCEKTKEVSYRTYSKNISNHNKYACSNKCAVIKGEMTCLEKYGTKYALQNEEVKEKTKQYFLDKYGVENTSQLESVKSKREETMMRKFGVKTNIILPNTHRKAIDSAKSKESKEKRENTMMDRYGVTNPMKSHTIYESFKKTNIEKYGHEYPAQNHKIYDKTQLSGHKVKYYNGIKYQGSYELDFLVKCEELDILENVSRLKSVKYQFDGKKKIYYPDFYIKSINLIVEIKSDYYYNLVLEKNLSKRNSCLDQGYKFLFIINKDYSEFIKIVQTGI